MNNLTDETKYNLSFEEYVKSNASEMDSFVYLRSNKMKYNLPVSEKIQKKVESYIKELGIPEKLIPTNKVEQAYDNLRNNLIILTSLKKHLDKKEREFIKLNHVNIDFQNKYAVPRNIGAVNNPNVILPINNIINPNLNNSNVTLSLQESNENINHSTILTNKEKIKKNTSNNMNKLIRKVSKF